MRYYLESPVAKGHKLMQKGQMGNYPIYHCSASNTSWVLFMYGSKPRHLRKFDPSGVRLLAEVHPVPDDWEGEPQVIGIEETTYDDLVRQHGVGPLVDIVQNGDVLVLIDLDGVPTRKFVVDGTGRLSTVPFR
jgi:hypothetical protein